MEKLSDIAKRRLNQHRLGEVSQASEVLFLAQKFLRVYFEEDPEAVKPLKLHHATLTLGVPNASWAQEVRGVSEKLLLELQSHCGPTLVQTIHTKNLTSTPNSNKISPLT